MTILMMSLPFWALNVEVALLSMQSPGELPDLIKNILICGPKMNEGLVGLERREGE